MYELLFWEYEEGVYLNHHEVYESLVDGTAVDGLQEINQEVIMNRITSVFKNWDKVDDTCWKNNNGIGAFQIKTTLQHVSIDCYGTDGKTMELIAQTLEEFKLPLYDPQIPARYDEFHE